MPPRRSPSSSPSAWGRGSRLRQPWLLSAAERAWLLEHLPDPAAVAPAADS
ncbi:MAG: hypothetical protein RML12_10825 [Xanthomonadales bacterium]|nr:hypothetical protein [Xanthomonadales bacterium]